jgi:hypothetical protein
LLAESKTSEVAAAAAGTGTWVKKYDVSHTWVLNSQGDQLVHRYEVYELDVWDEVPIKEYWRVDPYIDHLLKTYRSDTWHCGPYIHERRVLVDAQSAEVYDYDPPTTAQGSGASVNIGFTVTTGGIGMTIGYSWSWTNPGVRYDTTADSANSNLNWVETFDGPDYTWWPWYAGPTSAAYNSYNAKPTVVMRTSVGSGFYLSQLKSTWQTYDDSLTWLGLVLKVDRVITTYNEWWTPNRLSSSFGGGIQTYSTSGSLSGTGATYTFSLPSFADTYTVVMVGNEQADFDLYAKWNSAPTTSSYDARGFSGYSSEYFKVTGLGTLYIMVRSYSGSGRWRCNVVTAGPRADSGRKVGTLSSTGSTSTYSLAGSGRAWVYLAGPDSSDFDLYIKWNSPPTTSSYDAVGYSSWAQEICTATGSGTLYYMVRSYSGSGEYTMVALIF